MSASASVGGSGPDLAARWMGESSGASRATPAATLGEFLTLAAERFGDHPALLFKPSIRTWETSFRGLEDGALRLGRFLQEQGIAQGDRVLVCAPNMPEWVQLFFACHKIGAVPVPLDVRSAPSFVSQIAEITEARLGIFSRFTAQLERIVRTPTLRIEDLDGLSGSEPSLLEAPGVIPDDVAEIMFTSGTTGVPKGVMLTHRNILSNVAGSSEVLSVTPDWRLLSILPLSHMLEQTVGLLCPLANGAGVVYPTSRQPAALFRAFAEHRVNMLVLVPQALQLFLNAIEREARRRGQEASLQRLFQVAGHVPPRLRRLVFRSVHRRFGGGLRVIVSGGAHLDPLLARRWELMGILVLQGYGATETSPIITCDRPGVQKLGAVGRPFPEVEVGVATDGEVLARGPGVFRGYWRNPAATGQVIEGDWYHTGDIGVFDDDGYLHLKGRKKDLIVLENGQNVFPEDVEYALIAQPAVNDAVVVGLESAGSSVQVHAVILAADTSAVPEAVRLANQQLADHQRVQGYTVWPDADFPRTHTLKVKKHEVLERVRGLAGGVSAPVAAGPDSDERPLYRLLVEMASVPPGSIRSEQSLGGDLNLDSLGRVELLSAIEQELGAYVDESRVAPSTTVAELERLVAEAPPGHDGAGFVAWPLNPLTGAVRELVMQLVFFPAYHLLWRIRVVGGEGLRDLDGPIILAANHNFGVGTVGLDPVAAWMGLPRHLRLRISTAGEEHAVFSHPLKAFIARLCNTFPLSQEGNVRASLELVGRMLDRGWSVLIFPEGKLTVGGPIQPFKGGTGMLAVEARAAVVPLRIDLERPSVLEGGRWLSRGAFTVRVGDPLILAPGTPVALATQRIEEAVRSL